MGAKHPEFCQKQELRAINSQSVCTQQACYLNADKSPVNFDDCLSSYFSMSIMSRLLIFSPLSFTFIFSIHYSLSVFQLSIKAPLPRDRWQIDKHLPIKCSIFLFFFYLLFAAEFLLAHSPRKMPLVGVYFRAEPGTGALTSVTVRRYNSTDCRCGSAFCPHTRTPPGLGFKSVPVKHQLPEPSLRPYQCAAKQARWHHAPGNTWHLMTEASKRQYALWKIYK